MNTLRAIVDRFIAYGLCIAFGGFMGAVAWLLDWSTL